MLTVLIVLF